MKIKKPLFVILALFVLQTSALANVIQNQTVIAGTLSNSAGYPLYTFEKDTSGVSNCNGQCAAVWPPVIVKSPSEVPAGFTSFKRQDGSVQLADDEGKGLYSFVQDVPGTATKPATARGHGLRDFYLAPPVRAAGNR